MLELALPWLLLLLPAPWLVYRLQTGDHSLSLQLWSAYVAATIAISLIFDALDLYRYAKGQTTFSWGP